MQDRSIDWEQRYNTLQGKYNTEMPELRGQIKVVAGPCWRNMQVPRHARRGDVRDAARTPRPLPPPTREIPAEDVETYGQDLISATQRWTEAKVRADHAGTSSAGCCPSRAATSNSRITPRSNSVNAALSRAVPDWEAINVDPNFILWLDQIDLFSGQKRKQMIDEAYNAGDAARTIAFFRAYKNEQTVVARRRGHSRARPVKSSGGPAAPRGSGSAWAGPIGLVSGARRS